MPYSADAPVSADDYRRAPAPVLRLRYDGSRVQSIQVRGHKVQVAVYESGQQPDGKEGGYFRPPEIMFTAATVAVSTAVDVAAKPACA